MSEYIMDPGARLVVGPRGHLDETLGRTAMGACCSACAKQPLGAELSAVVQRSAIPMSIVAAVPSQSPTVTTTTPPAVRTATLVGLGIVGLVGVLVVRRMRRRR